MKKDAKKIEDEKKEEDKDNKDADAKDEASLKNLFKFTFEECEGR
jgi:hypothetical protein